MSPRERERERKLSEKIILGNSSPIKKYVSRLEEFTERWRNGLEKKPNPRAHHCEISGHKAREDSRSFGVMGEAEESHILRTVSNKKGLGLSSSLEAGEMLEILREEKERLQIPDQVIIICKMRTKVFSEKPGFSKKFCLPCVQFQDVLRECTLW